MLNSVFCYTIAHVAQAQKKWFYKFDISGKKSAE